MPIFLEVDESVDPRTTGTYEPDRVPQGFQAPDTYGRMRPNQFSGAKIGGGYDAPQGTPTWEPSWDQTSGITHQDLGGAQVMDAGWEVFNPGYWWQKGSDWEHGTDHAKEYETPWKFWEQDSAPWQSAEGYGPLENTEKEWNKAQIRMNEPSARAAEEQFFDEATEQGFYPWEFRTQPMSEYGDTLYDDSGNQQWAVTAENVEEMERGMEASVAPDDWRTIIKILEAGGNPDDYITNVDYDEEEPVEKGGGWLSNPLMKELRRRREKQLEDRYLKRMMEDNQKFNMDMLMNRHKFNLTPGTGEENPIFGDPYWNI
jgi:hypothetical protein